MHASRQGKWPRCLPRLEKTDDFLLLAAAGLAALCVIAIVAIALAILLAQPAAAHTVRQRDFVCPIDGETFRQTMDSSGTSFGRMLDLQHYGAIASPWALPVCPTSGFVMFRPTFKDEELARLREFVGSDEYAALKDETSYYRAAKLRAFLGEDPEPVAFTLLSATWQARGGARYERYAREALAAFALLLAAPAGDEKKAVTYEMLSGELERRLGMFEAARQRFERLKGTEPFKAGIYPDIVELQLRLIAEKDRQSHRIPTRK